MNELITAKAAGIMTSVRPATQELATQTRQQTRGFGQSDFDRFLRYLQVSPQSQQTYTRALRQLTAFLSAHGRAFVGEDGVIRVQADRDDIIAFREELIRSGHRPSTVGTYLAAARGFFGWLEAEGLCDNACAHVKAPRLDKGHKKDYLTPDQCKSILRSIDTACLKGKRDYAMIALMMDDGLRCIEVSRANVEDLRPLGGSTVLFVQGKGHNEKADFVRIVPQVETAIREYLAARGPVNGTDPLFASSSNNNNGQRLTTRSISGIVKSRMQAAGYDSERLTAHSLRHSAVTIALLQGQSLEATKQFARHQSVETTLVYSHQLERATNQCAHAVASAIFDD